MNLFKDKTIKKKSKTLNENSDLIRRESSDNTAGSVEELDNTYDTIPSSSPVLIKESKIGFSRRISKTLNTAFTRGNRKISRSSKDLLDSAQPDSPSVVDSGEHGDNTSQNSENSDVESENTSGVIPTIRSPTGNTIFYTNRDTPPTVEAENCVRSLSTGNSQEVSKGLKDCIYLLMDYAFACEFVKEGGHEYIIDYIKNRSLKSEELEVLLLRVFSLLTDYTFTDGKINDRQLISWDLVSDDFISSLNDYLNERHSDPKGFKACIDIFTAFLQNCPQRSFKIISSFDPTTLFDHLQRSSSQRAGISTDIHKSFLILLLTIFDQTNAQRPEDLSEIVCNYLSATKLKILVNCIPALQESCTTMDLTDEMIGYLSKLQFYLLFPLTDIYHSDPKPQDTQLQEHMEYLCALFLKGFSVSKIEKDEIEAYKKIGFENPTSPFDDFSQTPPGLLAFNCLYHTALQHENRIQDILNPGIGVTIKPENKFPLIAAAKTLTVTLMELFKIDDDGTTTTSKDLFCPMLFSAQYNKPFEETFAYSFSQFNHTWHAMKAIKSDLESVERVVREQIKLAFKNHPYTFSAFENRLQEYTPQDIKNSWRADSRNQKDSLVCPNIKELTELLKPKVYDLIRQRRLKSMEKGDKFMIAKTKQKISRDRACILHLSANHKVMTFDDLINNRSEAWQVNHIKNVTQAHSQSTGKKKERLNKDNIWCFDIEVNDPDKQESEIHSFCALDEKTFHYWMDGFNILLNKEMDSSLFERERDTLLNLDLKIRLLDIDIEKVSGNPPEIPQLPDNYDFFN